MRWTGARQHARRRLSPAGPLGCGTSRLRRVRPRCSRCCRGSSSPLALTKRVTQVNRYGAMARDHWARWLPARFAAISDPDSFFSDLGTRTGQLALELAGDDRPGEGYLEKAGRLGEARHRAEEIVLPEEMLLPPEPGADEDEPEQGQVEPSGLDFLYMEDLPGL
jgi:hypothetical protein